MNYEKILHIVENSLQIGDAVWIDTIRNDPLASRPLGLSASRPLGLSASRPLGLSAPGRVGEAIILYYKHKKFILIVISRYLTRARSLDLS